MQRESVASVLAVFVLLGFAGLAVAADLPSAVNSASAEAAKADAAAEPYLASLEAALDDVRAPVTTIATAGREVAEKLQALDVDGMRTSVASATEAFTQLDAALDDLIASRDQAVANVDAAKV